MIEFQDAYEHLRAGLPLQSTNEEYRLQWDSVKNNIHFIQHNDKQFFLCQELSVEQALDILFNREWVLAELPEEIQKETVVEQVSWKEELDFNPVERKFLKEGDQGEDVEYWQRRLVDMGATIEPDGDFGGVTKRAVINFQRAAGLIADGIIGENTRSALMGEPVAGILKKEDIQWAADYLKCEEAAVLAVNEVESSGRGFFAPGKPAILFERHWMRRRLAKHGIDYRPFMKQFPSVVNTRAGGYKGGIAEYGRLDTAISIHSESALESASWGAYQIMGFHWEFLGYESVDDFVLRMKRSARDQLEAFVRFIEKNPNLHRAIQKKDWPAFAHGYNGPAYRKNRYDEKMANAHRRYAS